jgi:integrase/recombinase XerD
MSALAPTVQAWFTEHLLTQRQASPRTVAAYRDTLRMLLAFAQARTGKAPSQLDVADVDASLIGAFLTHLEQERHNSARTRNARLAAIRSLYRYAALRHPVPQTFLREEGRASPSRRRGPPHGTPWAALPWPPVSSHQPG